MSRGAEAARAGARYAPLEATGTETRVRSSACVISRDNRDSSTQTLSALASFVAIGFVNLLDEVLHDSAADVNSFGRGGGSGKACSPAIGAEGPAGRGSAATPP